jgi:hypothetical protein
VTQKLPGTKPQQYLELMRQARLAEMDAYHLRQRANTLKREMGHPDDEQIERAAKAGKEIVRGCEDGP